MSTYYTISPVNCRVLEAWEEVKNGARYKIMEGGVYRPNYFVLNNRGIIYWRESLESAEEGYAENVAIDPYVMLVRVNPPSDDAPLGSCEVIRRSW